MTATSPVFVDGLAVYQRERHRDRPRVVLVHGSMDRAAAFRKAARHLHDVDVTLYDRRGYGRSASDGRTCGTIQELVADLLVVIGDEPSIVVGHSLGAVVALAAAQGAPDRIIGVGAFEPPMPWRPWWPEGSAGGVARAAADAGDPAAAAEQFMRRLLGDERWEELPESTKRRRRAEGPALVADLTALRSGAPPFDGGTLPVPLVVGYGGATNERHRRASVELAAEAGGAPLVCIDDAPHGAHYSHPRPFADFVRRTVAHAAAPTPSRGTI